MLLLWRFLHLYYALTILTPLALGWHVPSFSQRRQGTRISLSSIPDYETQLSRLESVATTNVGISSTSSSSSTTTAALREKNNSNENDDLITAAAAATKEKCPLLGIKSLGVDYGLVRTGIAVTSGYNPEPLHIIEQSNATLLAQTIVQIASSIQGLSQIILGLPLHKNGTEAEQTALTRAFGHGCLAPCILSTLGPTVPLYLWDERYTSKEAAARAHARDPNLPLYGTLDAESACIILETYYNDNGVGAEEIVLTEEERIPYLKEYERRQEDGLRHRQAVLEQRELNMNKRQEAMERAKMLEQEMRAAGTLGESNKSKKKKKKQLAKKRESTTWILP
ncbi:putative ribonuclease [Fragilaria crotonensis]|nr:putative ribonuclease [Fragilaria crotonensis]